MLHPAAWRMETLIEWRLKCRLHLPDVKCNTGMHAMQCILINKLLNFLKISKTKFGPQPYLLVLRSCSIKPNLRIEAKPCTLDGVNLRVRVLDIELDTGAAGEHCEWHHGAAQWKEEQVYGVRHDLYPGYLLFEMVLLTDVIVWIRVFVITWTPPMDRKSQTINILGSWWVGGEPHTGNTRCKSKKNCIIRSMKLVWLMSVLPVRNIGTQIFPNPLIKIVKLTDK